MVSLQGNQTYALMRPHLVGIIKIDWSNNHACINSHTLLALILQALNHSKGKNTKCSLSFSPDFFFLFLTHYSEIASSSHSFHTSFSIWKMGLVCDTDTSVAGGTKTLLPSAMSHCIHYTLIYSIRCLQGFLCGIFCLILYSNVRYMRIMLKFVLISDVTFQSSVGT